MEEESKIKKAKPKQGLETGGLKTGSLSPKDQVAKAYEADLSGKNGARARFDALEELMSRQLEEFASRLTFTSGDGMQIFGADGHFVIQSPNGRKAGVGVAAESKSPIQGLWDLAIEDFDDGEVSIRVGAILDDPNDLTSTLTITNGGSVFAVDDGDIMFLKITDVSVTPGVFTPACELMVDTTWTDHPAPYEITNTGASASFTAYYYPLYYFDTTFDAEAIAVADGVYGHKIVDSKWFRLIFTIRQEGTDRGLTVPFLMPSHGPLPT